MPTRFTIDPARVDEFIEDLSAPENSLRDVASKWQTTLGALSLFLASPEGLAIAAAAEIATAVHIRLQAQALLADVAQSMVYIVREYSREERRIPFNNDLKSIKLVEMRRANARRAGHLLFRLAHYTPAPIRSYTARPFNTQTSPCGTAVALDSRGLAHENHACAEPQACHTNETSHVSDAVAPPLATSASAYHDHIPLCEDGRGLSPCDALKRQLEHGEARDIQVPPSTPHPTSITSESASEIVVHVGAANTSSPVPPVGGSATTGVEDPTFASKAPECSSDVAAHGGTSTTPLPEFQAAMRGPHARDADQYPRTSHGSSALSHPPVSLASGP